MYKVIKIENREIPMMSNGGTLCEYRRFFNRDMIGDYLNLELCLKKNEFDKFDSLALARMMWVCAYRADKKIPEFEQWIEQFEGPFSFFAALEEFSKFLGAGMKTNVKPKKKIPQKRR